MLQSVGKGLLRVKLDFHPRKISRWRCESAVTPTQPEWWENGSPFFKFFIGFCIFYFYYFVQMTNKSSA